MRAGEGKQMNACNNSCGQWVYTKVKIKKQKNKQQCCAVAFNTEMVGLL